MATTVKVPCREHPGGYFTRPQRRGRPPVRCAPEYPCTASTTEVKQATPEQVAKAVAKALDDAAANSRKRLTPENVGEVVATARRRQQGRSLVKAKQAKEQLQSLGWTVEGQGSAKQDAAGITATRGTELLVMAWIDGNLTSQHYSLWDADHTPEANNRPRADLPFDPDEIPDRELVQKLSGVKVTWYNKLGDRIEESWISPNAVEIVHQYNGIGDETPGARIVRFVDASGGGFRAFRLDALTKVG